MSGPHNLIAPLKLVWDVLGYGDVNLDSVGHRVGLYSRDYDPFARQNETQEGMVTLGIFHPEFPGNEYVDKLRAAYQLNGARHWMLDPVMYEELGKAAKWDVDFGHRVAGPLLQYTSTRRGMLTPMMLDSGTVYPSSGIPPMTIHTEELEHLPEFADQVRKHGLDMQKMSSGTTASAEEAAMTQQVPGSTQNAAIQTMSFAGYRMGVLGAHDARNIQLLDILAGRGSTDVASVTRLVRQLGRIAMAANREPDDANDIDDAGDNVTPLGLQEVRRIIEDDHTGGLSEIYRRLRQDPYIPALASCAQYVYWFAAGSPIFARILELLLRYVQVQKKRVVIFCDTPWIQQ